MNVLHCLTLMSTVPLSFLLSPPLSTVPSPLSHLDVFHEEDQALGGWPSDDHWSLYNRLNLQISLDQFEVPLIHLIIFQNLKCFRLFQQSLSFTGIVMQKLFFLHCPD